MEEVGVYIIYISAACLVFLQLCPKKYILTKGALANSMTGFVRGVMLPNHMLNKRGKTIKVMSYTLLLIGIIVFITGSI